jgi:hypothetical protein
LLGTDWETTFPDNFEKIYFRDGLIFSTNKVVKKLFYLRKKLNSNYDIILRDVFEKYFELINGQYQCKTNLILRREKV